MAADFVRRGERRRCLGARRPFQRALYVRHRQRETDKVERRARRRRRRRSNSTSRDARPDLRFEL